MRLDKHTALLYIIALQRTDYWCDSSHLKSNGAIFCYNAPCDSLKQGTEAQKACIVREYLQTHNKFGDTTTNLTVRQHWEKLQGLPSLLVGVVLLVLVARRGKLFLRKT